MAERGKLIPISVRMEIKERLATEAIRKVADALRLSKTTVYKYGSQNGTKSLNRERLIG